MTTGLSTAAALALQIFFALSLSALHCPSDADHCLRDSFSSARSSPADESQSQVALPPLHQPPPTDASTIFLTFDDGPHPIWTPMILDVLARHDARATFFVTGQLAASYPNLVEQIASAGHTLANHTWGHEALTSLSQQEFKETLLRTQAVLGEHATPCLRPPYFLSSDDVRQQAARLGLRLVFGSLAPQDWQLPGADVIAERIITGAYPGAVIVLHDGGGDRSQTVEGLAMALDILNGAGFAYEPICS